jgi:hypothetical protein
VQKGSFAVLDQTADRWWSRDDLISWGDYRPFSFAKEIALDHQTLDDGRTSLDFLCTRGMQKVGRAELLMTVPAETDPQLLAHWRYQFQIFAERMAMGAVYHADDVVEDMGFRMRFLRYREGIVDVEPELPAHSLVAMPDVLFARR